VRIQEFRRHIEYNYREGGVGQILDKVLYRIRRPLWSGDEWLVYRLSLADLPQGATLPLETSLLGFEDLRAHSYFKVLAFPEGIRKRLQSGASCHGFFLNGELVNFAWSSTGYLEIESGVRVVEDGCAGIFDCYTLPAYRSKGIYTNSLLIAARLLRDGGATFALIGVDPVNLASIKGIERAGFRPYCRVIRRLRFGRQSLRQLAFSRGAELATGEPPAEFHGSLR